MTRRFVEVVHVGVSGDRPVAFRWRGHRYVVQDVLGHWRERRAWWATPAARAVLTGGSGPQPGLGAQPGPGAQPGSGRTDWNAALAEEYEVWRVEAGRRGSEVIGVYDLCHDTGVRPDIGVWRLLRIAD